MVYKEAQYRGLRKPAGYYACTGVNSQTLFRKINTLV